MDGVTGALNKLFQDLSSGWVNYLLAVAGLGILTMGILEAIKQTLPLRESFQRRRMLVWLGKQSRQASTSFERTVCPLKAQTQLELLATNGNASALYGLEVEKLCGQWNAAMQIVLDYPEKYTDLFACLAGCASRNDFEDLLDRRMPQLYPPQVEAKLPDAQQVERYGQRQAFIDARTRVTHQMQRAIDSFQIVTASGWKLIMQVSSFSISFLLALTALLIHSHFHCSEISTAFLSAVPAAFLAPVARDLVVAIEKLRS